MRAELLVPASLDEVRGEPGEVVLAGGTEVVPQLREGLIDAGTLADVSALVPRGIDGSRIGAGTTLAELEACLLYTSPSPRD